MNKQNTIPALDKAVDILEFLGRRDAGASQAELVSGLGISTSTCYRIMQTLLARNWVKSAPKNTYDIAEGILVATEKLTDSTARFKAMQPILDRLAERTGLSCKISVRQGDFQATILRAESPAPMAVSGKLGARFPLIEGSTGAALMFKESGEQVRALMKRCPEEVDEKNDATLIEERKNSLTGHGYCMNNQENRWRVEAMAAPILDKGDQVIAALTVLGFEDDFSSKTKESIAAELKRAVTACTKAFGS